MKRFTLFLLLLTVAFCFGSCDFDSKDGDWDSIKVTINGKYIKNNTIDVPAEGGTYVMSSRNYGVPWVLNIEIDGSKLWAEGNWEDYIDNALTSDWLYYKSDAKNGHIIKFEPNQTSVNRIVRFELECGDAFEKFTFVQRH